MTGFEFLKKQNICGKVADAESEINNNILPKMKLTVKPGRLREGCATKDKKAGLIFPLNHPKFEQLKIFQRDYNRKNNGDKEHVASWNTKAFDKDVMNISKLYGKSKVELSLWLHVRELGVGCSNTIHALCMAARVGCVLTVQHMS